MKNISSITLATVLGLAVVSSAKAGVGYNGDFTGYGNDTQGPEIYLTYNGTSVNVALASTLGYATTDQGPYDGADDTYIGVINTSSTTLSSINLSGTQDIFGFDDDGIQSFGSPVTATQFAATGGIDVSEYLNGVVSPGNFEGNGTGYAGFNNYFSNVNESASPETGTINFVGGLAPGATAYFSLEEALSGAIGTGGGLTGGGNSVPDAGSTMALLGASLIGLGSLRRSFKQ
jgi:hypothetical protein